MRIVVAMSGGVDSSVAAALLAEQGHDVIGVSMQLYPSTPDGLAPVGRSGRAHSRLEVNASVGRSGQVPAARDDHGAVGRSGQATDAARAREYGTCCTLDDLHDARRVAAAIGIPHYILNFESRFDEAVVSNFVREYVSGRTPIPCSHCNSDLKFAALLDRALALDAAALATGHYARIVEDDHGRFHLRRGLDPAKDQSYFLFALTQAQMAQALFPIGDLDKDTVRAHARRLGLRVADKPDSQEICFVPDGDYAAFVERQAPALTRPGAIVSEDGRLLGTHEGVHRFTIGQRKGLRLSSSDPLYVLAIDAGAARVTVGPRDALGRTGLVASGVNWTSGEAPPDWQTAAVQIRHRHTAAPARVRAIDEDRAEVEFDAPQTAVTPGQAVVFYEGDEVVGGGWID